MIFSDDNPSIAQVDLLQDAGGTLFSFEIGKPRYDLTAMHSTALDKYCVTLIVSTPQSQKMRDHYRNKVGPREGRSASEPRFLCLDSPPTLAGTSNQLQKESAQPRHTQGTSRQPRTSQTINLQPDNFTAIK